MLNIGLQFEINFDDNLWSCFKSVELLETMKFVLPDSLRMIAIQKEKTQRNLNAVGNMISMYNEIIDKLNESQVTKFFLLRNSNSVYR